MAEHWSPVTLSSYLRDTSLGRISSSTNGYSSVLRVIDFFKIPRDDGDCVVLLLVHPGLNLLGHYLPPSKINDLLLADISRVRPVSKHDDVYMMGIEEHDMAEEVEAFDIMDLASFMEYAQIKWVHSSLVTTASRFAIQSTRCLETLHKLRQNLTNCLLG